MNFKRLLQFKKVVMYSIYGFAVQLFLVSLLLASGNTNAQKIVSVKQMNISVDFVQDNLVSAFTKIESQSGYSFVFDKKDLDKELRINGKYQEDALYDVLLDISKKSGLTFKQVNRNINVQKISERFSWNKNNKLIEILADVDINGKISDENGQGLPGASVVIKGTTTGTTSDLDGKYKLSVPEGSSVTVTFVGYVTQEIAVGSRSEIDIQMTPDARQLEEIVVIGFGEQKKVNLTGSVGSVDGDELVKRPVSNVGNLLQGKVAGVQVTQAFAKPGDERNTIRIRGTGTFSGAGSGPLILINGIAGDMSNLNPDDIESVSVLKDAASSAIYGARAANGVVLVTTKRGKNQPLTISYHANVQAQQATRLPNLLSNSADYMELWNEARVRNGASGHFTQATINAFRNNPNDPNDPNFDWIDHSFRTGVAQNHHLNLNGGDEKTSYNVSIGYLDQDGITSIYEYQKYNALFSVNSKVNNWLTLGGEIQFVKKDIRKSAWDNDVDYQILAIYGAGPNYTPTKVLPDGSVGYIARYSSSIAEWTVRNPDAQDVSGSIIERGYNVVPQFMADIKFHENLTWSNKAAFSLSDDFSKGHEHPVDNYYFEDNSYAHNNATWRLGVREQSDQSTLSTFYSTLNYKKDVNDTHFFNALAGYNQESFFYRELRGSRRLFPTNDLKELSAASPDGQNTGGTANEWAIRSYFGRVAYNFKSKYLFEMNARYDGSSRINPDNRWGFFPSISGAWRISEEAFADGLGWMDNLKIRASWGKLGNQNIGNYPYQEVLSTTSYPFGGSTSAGVRQTRLVDQSLQWETTTMTDIGIDLSISGGLFTATLDWYDKVTDDILYGIPVPASVGLSAPTVNFGKMRNKGIEIDLGHAQQLGDFGYRVSFNVARNRNEVLRILSPTFGERTIQEGLPWNSHYLIEFDGIFQNQAEIDGAPVHPFNPKPGDLKYKDQNGDNKIDSEDRVVVDGAYPDFIFGGNLSVSWKNFSISAFFQGISGQKVNSRILTWGLGNFMQGSPPSVDFVENRWTPDNPTNEYPAIFGNGYGPVTGTPSTYWLHDASYLRLKNLLIEYHVPSNVVEKIGLRDLRVYASGDNLFTITNYKGADPEALDNNWFTAYPQIQIFTLGVRVKL